MELKVDSKKYDRLVALYVAADRYVKDSKAGNEAEKKKSFMALETAVFNAAEFFDNADG